MSETTDTAGMWAVLDSNAKTAKRVHEAGGQQHALHAFEKTYMPKEIAMVFLRDSAFVVFDEDGNRQMPLPSAEVEGDRRVPEKLEPGQCVAHYDELTTTALLARVIARPGGRAMPPDASRAQMVAFLSGAPMRQDAAQKVRPSQLSADPRVGDDNPALGRLPSMEEQLQNVPTTGGGEGVELEDDPLMGG